MAVFTCCGDMVACLVLADAAVVVVVAVDGESAFLLFLVLLAAMVAIGFTNFLGPCGDWNSVRISSSRRRLFGGGVLVLGRRLWLRWLSRAAAAGASPDSCRV